MATQSEMLVAQSNPVIEAQDTDSIIWMKNMNPCTHCRFKKIKCILADGRPCLRCKRDGKSSDQCNATQDPFINTVPSKFASTPILDGKQANDLIVQTIVPADAPSNNSPGGQCKWEAVRFENHAGVPTRNAPLRGVATNISTETHIASDSKQSDVDVEGNNSLEDLAYVRFGLSFENKGAGDAFPSSDDSNEHHEDSFGQAIDPTTFYHQGEDPNMYTHDTEDTINSYPSPLSPSPPTHFQEWMAARDIQRLVIQTNPDERTPSVSPFFDPVHGLMKHDYNEVSDGQAYYGSDMEDAARLYLSPISPGQSSNNYMGLWKIRTDQDSLQPQTQGDALNLLTPMSIDCESQADSSGLEDAGSINPYEFYDKIEGTNNPDHHLYVYDGLFEELKAPLPP